MLILDDSGGDGGVLGEATAPFTFLLSEPTLHAFSPELVEDAQRNTYQCDNSGVVFSLVVSGEALRFSRETGSTLIATVAGQLAAVLDQDAAVPGVADMVETQDTTPLGSLKDVWQIAITSTSGRSTNVFTYQDFHMRPDVFEANVKAQRAQMDAQEKQS